MTESTWASIDNRAPMAVADGEVAAFLVVLMVPLLPPMITSIDDGDVAGSTDWRNSVAVTTVLLAGRTRRSG